VGKYGMSFVLLYYISLYRKYILIFVLSFFFILYGWVNSGKCSIDFGWNVLD